MITPSGKLAKGVSIALLSALLLTACLDSAEDEIELQEPNLRFTAAPKHLLTGHTTRFMTTLDGEGALTWSIVENRAAASINAATGLVTAA